MIAKKLKNDTLSKKERDVCEILTREDVYGIGVYLDGVLETVI
jgi:hypothetical protein